MHMKMTKGFCHITGQKYHKELLKYFGFYLKITDGLKPVHLDYSYHIS